MARAEPYDWDRDPTHEPRSGCLFSQTSSGLTLFNYVKYPDHAEADPKLVLSTAFGGA